MNRSWVRFPQAAQIRPPGSGWAFLYACLLLVPRWCSGRRRARLWGRAALCARGRRPAREPSAPRASLGASPRSPARPSGPSGALHTGGAWSLMHGSVCRPEAWPGPAAAHGHRSLALRSLRRPSHQWGVVADVWLGASPRSLARPRHRPQAPQPGSPNPNVVRLVVLGFWGAPLCVVTNVVNRRCFSCGFLIRCYKRRQSDGFFAENQGFWT